MAANDHQTYLYVGLAGEGQFVGEGGLYRYAVDDETWESITQGLPPTPQVRALLIRPDDPAVLYADTQYGLYRSDDRGAHWEALDTHREGRDVWSLACHPEHPDVLYAGYEPSRSPPPAPPVPADPLRTASCTKLDGTINLGASRCNVIKELSVQSGPSLDIKFEVRVVVLSEPKLLATSCDRIEDVRDHPFQGKRIV